MLPASRSEMPPRGAAAETRLEREMALTELLQVTAVVANETSSVEATVRVCLESFCRYAGWELGHWQRLDESDNSLVSGEVWNSRAEDVRFADFRAATSRIRFRRGVGVPGRILASGEYLWVTDVNEDRNFPRGPWAAATGLRSCLGFPIKVGRQVVGVLEFFTVATLPPDERLLQVMRNVAAQIARVEERRRAERELVAARELAVRASLAKSQFLANVSHEIRTPLNALVGAVELLQLTVPTRAQLRHLKTMRDASGALLNVIHGVLDFAKIESGRLELETKRFSLREVLASVENLLEPVAREKALRFGIQIATTVPDALVGDAGRLRQVLLNLAGNALKFTEAGRVDVRITRDANAAKGVPAKIGLRFTIRDTGIGIAADALTGLFRPFAQADASSTRRHGGTGLGLSISRELARAMGGDVRIESAPGAGTTASFTASFGAASVARRRPGARPAAVPLPARTLARNAPCAIVIEDNAVNRRILVEMLRHLGYRAQAFASARAGIGAFRPGHHQIVLLDCQMPCMDGYACAAQLRAKEGRRSRVPIVAVSAHALACDRERCLSAGMDDYLAKPLALEDLRRTLERWRPFGSGQLNRSAWERLDRFGAGSGGADARGAVFRIFLDSGRRQVRAIARAAQRGDREGVAREAHALLSSSLYVGADALAGGARRLERIATRGEHGDLVDISKELNVCFESLSNILERESGELCERSC